MYTDANGILVYEGTDLIDAAGLHILLNAGQSATSDAVGDLDARLDPVEARVHDTGWMTIAAAGGAYAASWAAVAPTADWRSLSIRVLGGREVIVNGLVQKTASYTSGETIFTLSAVSGLRPTATSRSNNGDVSTDVQSDGRVRVRAAGSANTPFGVDLRWLLG